MSTILISAGEASGELYGAQLVESLRRAEVSPKDFFGLGGEHMRAAGCDIVVDSREVAVVGLVEVVKHLPGIYRRFHDLLREVDRRKPDIAVLIDFPDFNFRLARELYRRGIPVVYFVSPQLWAWRQGRIRLVQKYVKKMLVIFPFEEKFYLDRGVDAEYVGHPLADIMEPLPSREEYARANGLDATKQWIGLLPGSRQQEVERHLTTMLWSAKILGQKYEFILPVASTLDSKWMKSKVEGFNIHLVTDARPALSHARASIVASGTATVEAALAGNPFVVVYRVSPLTYTFGRHLVSVPHYAMANLIAEKRVVPELIQEDYKPSIVVEHLRKLLPDGLERSQIMAGLAEVKRRLHPFSATETATDRAARVVLSAMQVEGA